jgi:ABC-type transport system involved in multi-copper enzyme maturation permease subunit
MNRTNTPQRSLVGRLVAKDLYLYRWLILGALLTGIASLFLSSVGPGRGTSEAPNLGFILFMTTIITFGIFLSMYGVLKEHQEKSRLFVLSLPVSPAQYVVSKVWAALLAFLAPWLVLTITVVASIWLSGDPRGPIPFFVVMMMFFLGNFCLLLAVVVIIASEIAAIVGILITTISVSLFLVHVGGLPGIAEHRDSAIAVWSPTILGVLSIEGALILVSLALAFYLPSRKRDIV